MSKVNYVTNMIGNMPKLVTINVPLNLSKTVYLNTPVLTNWVDEAGNVYTSLPLNVTESFVIIRQIG